jgi:antitoxin FitA
MANLIVRNIDESIVKALKKQASLHGVSAEAEHRKILEQVLLQPKKKSFTEVLMQIPNVGKDADFERVQDDSSKDVFD